jgi:hypothetical protein
MMSARELHLAMACLGHAGDQAVQFFHEACTKKLPHIRGFDPPKQILRCYFQRTGNDGSRLGHSDGSERAIYHETTDRS